MPLYAGFDIGIKNLAFCIIDSERWRAYNKGASNDPGIEMWENLNLVGDPEQCCGVIASGKKRGEQCGKEAKWVIKNQTATGVESEYYCGRHRNEWCKSYKPPLVKNINMRKLKKLAFCKLDSIDLFNQVAHIVLENQPRRNQQMKMFAAAIEAYFVIRQDIDNPDSELRALHYSSAKNKLKMYRGPPISVAHLKGGYDQRKYTAIKQTEYFLRDAPQVLERYFNPSKKKDDLADAFLHCILAIKGALLLQK